MKDQLPQKVDSETSCKVVQEAQKKQDRKHKSTHESKIFKVVDPGFPSTHTAAQAKQQK